MTTVTQGSIPEVVESTIGEALDQRTSILVNVNDLGPPDMVHLAKALANSAPNGKSLIPKVGTFFYYTGADTSNSATIAALLHYLANVIGGTPQLWFGKHKPWKISDATYCAYNAFSRYDVRVKVSFPGGVQSQMIDAQGTQVDESNKLWTETYVSSMVRSLITADKDPSDFTSVVEIRKINPLLSKSCTQLFLDGFEQLFFDGTKLGCSENIQIATNYNNSLVDAFFECIRLTGQYERGLEVLDNLESLDSGVACLKARLLLMGDEEVRAVKLMHDGIAANPLDGELLSLQAQFCLDKKRFDLALPIATKAVSSSPSYFKPWAILVKVYIALGQYEQALLTLNSCPMVTHKAGYVLKRINNPAAESMHLPTPVDVTLDKVSTVNSVDVAVERSKVDPSLVELPAANLKSTFAEAYELLTEIVNKTGWEALLKYRTKVFVMEEEFRNKASSRTSVDGSVKSGELPKKLPEAAKGEAKEDVAEDDLGDTDFRKKRLCERWLDNLFMLLYDDLRAYTMHLAGRRHFEAQQVEMKKSTLEWELTGLAASRLGHDEEAARCFESGLDQRFSPRCASKLLEHYNQLVVSRTNTRPVSELNDKILNLTVKLFVWNHRWYCNFSPVLIESLRGLVGRVGRTKLENEVKVLFDDANTGIFDLVSDNLAFLDAWKLVESDKQEDV